jgi:hypothetical protein
MYRYHELVINKERTTPEDKQQEELLISYIMKQDI